jgi:hypothetical protein
MMIVYFFVCFFLFHVGRIWFAKRGGDSGSSAALSGLRAYLCSAAPDAAAALSR